MKKNSKNEDNTHSNQFSIDVNGSLGLLAYGDKGLRAWRQVKQQKSALEPKSTKK